MATEVIEVELTREEIDALEAYHRRCENNFAEMREYESAQKHKERNYLFSGLKKTGWYLRMN